ncbi:MAG: hypothetical protein ABIN89_15405 [Chitinophagaceae bacterium]
MRKVLIAFLPFFSFISFAQDVKKTEQDLVLHFKKIDYWSTYKGNDARINSIDSLQKANEIFQQKLMEYTSKQPATLTYDFRALKKEAITIATSTDKKFRIYSWDTKAGGTMHFFKNVYQYQAGSKVFSKSSKTEEGDSGGWFSEIFNLNGNGKHIYMGYFNAIYSTSDAYQAIKFFTITNNELVDNPPLIKTKSGMNHELGFGFNFFSVANRKERPVKLIYFDSAQKTIKIPVVNAKSEVTKKIIIYKFSGKYFEYQGK